MLSRFVVQFNYSIEQFNFLTLKQIVEVLNFKYEYDQNVFTFFSKEFRTINFYTLKTSFGDTRKYSKPKDLYMFPDEIKYEKERLIEIEDSLHSWLKAVGDEL